MSLMIAFLSSGEVVGKGNVSTGACDRRDLDGRRVREGWGGDVGHAACLLRTGLNFAAPAAIAFVERASDFDNAKFLFLQL